jgi:hypothetical protein
MTENVTVREPEAAEDRPTEDLSNQKPTPAADRAGQATPATPDAVTTADMAAAGDRAATGDRTPAPEAAKEAVTEAEAETARGTATKAEAETARGTATKAEAETARGTATKAEAETARGTATKAEAETARGAATKAEAQTAAKGEAEAAASLFPTDQASGYRSRWQEIQTGFVDEPKAAVQEADTLVAEVMRQLARTFADERRQLEAQWSEGEEISTEDLRLALRRYRSFFDRLLSV